MGPRECTRYWLNGTVQLSHAIKEPMQGSVRKRFEKEFSLIPVKSKNNAGIDNGVEMAQHKLFTEHTKIQGISLTHSLMEFWQNERTWIGRHGRNRF